MCSIGMLTNGYVQLKLPQLEPASQLFSSSICDIWCVFSRDPGQARAALWFVTSL